MGSFVPRSKGIEFYIYIYIYIHLYFSICFLFFSRPDQWLLHFFLNQRQCKGKSVSQQNWIGQGSLQRTFKITLSKTVLP